MKRLIVLLVTLFVVIAITAQNSTNVKRQQHGVSIATGLVDPLELNGAETQNIVLDISAKNAIQLYSIYVSFTAGTNSGDTVVTSTLQKSYDSVDYYDIDTVKYLMTEDSAWIFEDLSTGVAVNYLRITDSMLSVGDTYILTGIEVKLYDK